MIFVGLAALLIWVADWTTISARRPTIDVLNRRLARGEINRAEYESEAQADWPVIWQSRSYVVKLGGAFP
jgi:uncharacterized membrane protein